MTPAPLRLCLMRHGGTAWALTSQHTGTTDIPLTTSGEDEARELGQRLRGSVFSYVLTSPRQRAHRTCELAGLGSAAAIDADLAEWHYGDYEGQRSVDIIKARPEWDLFRDGCPHGESPGQVSDRADRLIARLRRLGGNVALFSHGQFGGVLAARWLGLPLAAAQHFPLGTASLSILSYNPHHPAVPVIEMWNQTNHPLAMLPHHPRDGVPMPLKQRELERWDNEGGEIPDPKHNPARL
ncbi:histidine phosphatase family protein [Prosthecobacter sp.]|uniref:histidine phosphatase family protein n=1 Tax=Prosthecobacter sp. TaxID=1965333 RepID=UPI002488BF7B|nr:histidine phosphatase family protein [Prosthecobacter sp.]MDI1312553.1 histidine phosphatase family protein [Prosthecobacter sp.]